MKKVRLFNNDCHVHQKLYLAITFFQNRANRYELNNENNLQRAFVLNCVSFQIEIDFV